MESLSALFALCAGNLPVTGGFPSQKASNMELWCFLCCQPEQAVEQTIELRAIWDAMTLICRYNGTPINCRKVNCYFIDDVWMKYTTSNFNSVYIITICIIAIKKLNFVQATYLLNYIAMGFKKRKAICDSGEILQHHFENHVDLQVSKNLLFTYFVTPSKVI